ncbi:hypothetical protein J6590_098509 [Homalodisca vitripennis]|nr:hypothetical protein J6590_098509 [Homalodisca vitripennis]
MFSRDVVEEVYYVAEINISISTVHGAVQQAAVDCREARVVMAGGVIHQQWEGEGEAAVNPVLLIAGTAGNTSIRFMYGTTPC